MENEGKEYQVLKVEKQSEMKDEKEANLAHLITMTAVFTLGAVCCGDSA